MVLDGAGYEDFRRGIRKTGRQIDLHAKNKVTGYSIICECKAHEKPIGSGDLHKFYGIYDKEYRQNNKLVGLFFSLSVLDQLHWPLMKKCQQTSNNDSFCVITASLYLC